MFPCLCLSQHCSAYKPLTEVRLAFSFFLALFSHSPTASTQLARLFIKTSKLTSFNCVCFTRFVTSVYYLLRRPVPATSLRSLILSHKSRPSNSTSRTWFSRCALSSASLSFPCSIPYPFSFAMPFTPSAEYRSTHRNVVLAFAQVPFYPSA